MTKNPPYDLTLGKTHLENAQAFSRSQRKVIRNIVYIYTGGIAT